jgi:hypothetical protein
LKTGLILALQQRIPGNTGFPVLDLWIQRDSLSFGLGGANLSAAWCVQEIPVIGQAVTSVQDNMWRIVWSVSPEGTETE